MQSKIVLLGAYGYTGKMVAEKLASAEVYPVLAGKNQQKLEELKQKLNNKNEVLEIDITHITALEKLNDFEIIINCVGPYNLFSKNALDYAVFHGKTYLDICGEQAFVFNSYNRKNKFDKSGACIIHSLAFESALADLLAAEIINEGEDYKDISSFYYFENPAYSRGSRFSMQAMKHFPVYIYMENEFKQTHSFTHSHNLPVCFQGNLKALFIPYPELVFFAHNYKTANAGTWYLMDEDEASYATSNVLQTPKSIEKIKQKFSLQNAGPEKSEMEKQVFRLAVEAKTKSGNTKCIAVQGHDTYELTAEIMAQAILHLLNVGSKQIGLLTPSKLLKNADMLTYLRANNCIRIL